MRLVVSNKTGANLHFRTFCGDDDQRQSDNCLLPFSSDNVSPLRKNTRLQFSSFPFQGSYKKAVTNAVMVKLPQSSRALWKLLPGFESSPWLVYFIRVGDTVL